MTSLSVLALPGCASWCRSLAVLRPSPSARWSPASLTPVAYSVRFPRCALSAGLHSLPSSCRLPGDMFRSSARLSTGAPCHTAARAADAPIPLSAQAPGYPAAVTACAARLHTRFLALRLSLPLVIVRPSGLRIRSALPTGSPMISLEQEQPAVKAGRGGHILLGDFGWRKRPGRLFSVGNQNGNRCRCRVTRSRWSAMAVNL